MSYSYKLRGQNILAKAMAMVMAAQATGCATPGFFAIPAVSIDGVYDDNLYYSSEDETSDFIARVSPELEVGYEADTLEMNGRYRFDAEAYANETDLNSSNVRQFGDLSVDYEPTRRLTLSAAADYTKTDTPLDITIIPGVTIPGLLKERAEAERLSLYAAAGYRITPLTTGSLAATWTDEELVGTGESITTILESWIDQRLSEENTLNYGFIHREYRFDEFGLNPDLGPTVTRGATQESDTPWIGLTHQFNARTRVSVRGGPRIDDGSVDPYALLSLQHKFNNGDLRVDLERNETTLLGEPRKVDVTAIYAALTRRIGTRTEVQIRPGFARLDQGDATTDIYNLGLGAVYKVNEAVYLTATYDFNYQDVKSELGGLNEVSRNVVQVGVRFSYPRREPRVTR